MSRATGPSMAALVDSSLWVHQLRKSGDPVKRDRVNALLEAGEAAWCPAVRLELWRGVSNDAERKTLRRYEALLPDYEISADVWNRAIRLADKGRSFGVTVPLADLLIFACAKEHGVDVAHDDVHFDELAKIDV
jgi:predicted nucleic acid-binding protein